MPFLPAAILQSWAIATIAPGETNRVAMFSVDGRPQPAVCLLHKEVAPSIAAAVALGEFKLLSVLEAAAHVLALQHDQPPSHFLRYRPIASNLEPLASAGGGRRPILTESQRAAAHLWFTNLNTPQEFALARACAAALDT
jgi:molybdopterin-guanine dinucleotide biosynthesis protein A